MLLEDYSARSKKTLGDRTFKVAAPRIWNILPKDIRKQDNYYTFKKQLKTSYFKLTYSGAFSIDTLMSKHCYLKIYPIRYWKPM